MSVAQCYPFPLGYDLHKCLFSAMNNAMIYDQFHFGYGFVCSAGVVGRAAAPVSTGFGRTVLCAWCCTY